MVRSVLGIAAAACVFGGCAGVRSRGGVTPIRAPNPVVTRDGALAVTAPADATLRRMSAKDCSVWPIDDEYQVRVRGERVCATAVLSVPLLASAERAGAADVFDDRLPLLWVSDTALDGEAVTLEKTGPARKFGECLDGSGRLYGVWRQMYEHCGADPSLLTGRTRRLALQRPAFFGGGRDLVVWDFD